MIVLSPKTSSSAAWYWGNHADYTNNTCAVACNTEYANQDKQDFPGHGTYCIPKGQSCKNSGENNKILTKK